MVRPSALIPPSHAACRAKARARVWRQVELFACPQCFKKGLCTNTSSDKRKKKTARYDDLKRQISSRNALENLSLYGTNACRFIERQDTFRVPETMIRTQENTLNCLQVWCTRFIESSKKYDLLLDKKKRELLWARILPETRVRLFS